LRRSWKRASCSGLRMSSTSPRTQGVQG
jgi:hypothetical protein